MREILFRAKWKYDGRWIEGFYMGSNTILNDEKERYIVVPETVGQYTGLTDKNGTKIFEGDIVKYDFGKYSIGVRFAVIEYDVKHHGFLMKPIDDWMYANLEDCEVAGNIHDNPELIQEWKDE